jgi:fibronectin-binding autotransporter adhesin
LPVLKLAGIANPGGPVTIGGANILTLGASGINMGAATQNLTIASGLTLAADTKQTWTVGAGRALTISGVLTQSAGAAVAFDTTAGGTINISSGTATSILPYGVINGADIAALDATNNVTGVGALMTYNPNPVTAPNPNIAGAQNGIDVINLNATATNAFRLSNAATINAFGVSASTGVIRFNTEHPGVDWTIDMASNRALSWSDGNPVLLMTANTGASDVIFNGSGDVRAGNTGTIFIHQNNPVADMVFNMGEGFTQPVGGAAQLVKAGVGRIIIANNGHGIAAEQAQGTTHIAEGTVQIGNGGAVGNLNPASAVVNNGALAFSRNNAFTFANNISGSGTVTVNNVGTGEVTLSGANTYTGSTTLAGGFLNLTALDDIGAAAAPLIFNGGGVKHGALVDISTKTTTFNAGGALVDTNGNNVTYAGVIGGGGAGGLTKSGAGVLTLGGTNTYSGLNTVNGGTLRVNGSVLGAAVAASGGTLGGTGTINGGITVNSGGTLAPGASVGTLTGPSLTLDSGSLLTFEFGAGVNDRVVTTAANGLTINGGAVTLLQENSATAFANPGTFNLLQFAGAVQGTGVSSLSVANPETGFNYAFGTSGNNVTLTITSTGTVANWVTNGGGSWSTGTNWSTNPTIPNAAGASARFLTQLGAPATVTLDGGKTVGGVTFASANGYTIAAGSGGALTFSSGGGGPAQLNSTQGNHTISAGAQLTSNLSVEINAGSQVTMSGAVNGTGGIAMDEAGTLVLGNASNGYGGGTTINDGTVQFAALGSLGSGNVTLSGGGALRYGAGNTADISTKTITFGAGGGAIDTNGNNVTFANSIGNSGAGGFTKAGAGRLTMTGFANAYSGPTTVSGGQLNITANDLLGDPAVGAGLTLSGGGTLETDTFLQLDNFGANARVVTLGAGGGVLHATEFGQITLPGQVTGVGSLTKTGVGIVQLNVANNYQGGTTIQQGTLITAVTGALGTGAINLQGTAVLQQNDTTLQGTLNVSGTPILRGGGSTAHGVGAVAGTGTLNIEVTGGVFDFEGDLTGFTGVFNMTNVSGGGGRFFGGGSNNAATITFNLTGVGLANRIGSAQIFLGGLSGDAASTLTGATNATANPTEYVIGARNETSEYAGVISNGPGDGVNPALTNITKVGTGTLTLSALNTYTGNTSVNAGVLRITQSTALADTADVFIASGSTLNLDTGMTTADLIDSLYLNGLSQPVGEYGGIGSGAQFTTPFITGMGRLQVQNFDLPGDFNNNLTVEATDLIPTWTTAFGVNGNADADQDGDSDGADFLIWQRFLGQTAAAPASGTVPEPGMLALVGLALPAVVGASRRRRNA